MGFRFLTRYLSRYIYRLFQIWHNDCYSFNVSYIKTQKYIYILFFLQKMQQHTLEQKSQMDFAVEFFSCVNGCKMLFQRTCKKSVSVNHILFSYLQLYFIQLIIFIFFFCAFQELITAKQNKINLTKIQNHNIVINVCKQVIFNIVKKQKCFLQSCNPGNFSMPLFSKRKFSLY